MSPKYAYIGRKWCGCVVAACTDRGDPGTARWVASFIEDGLTVERVPTASVSLVWDCPHPDKAPPTGQLTIFESAADVVVKVKK